MLYTIGDSKSYRLAFQEVPRLTKIGYREVSDKYPVGYIGGIVFLTHESAIMLAKHFPGYEVFGLITDESNIKLEDKTGAYHLIKDAEVVILDDTTI